MANIKAHSYAASIGSDLASDLIKEFGIANGYFLDIFAGSGTTLVEALNHGMFTYGVDVDPIACLICRTQTRKYTNKWLSSFEIEIIENLDKIKKEIIQNLKIILSKDRGEWFSVNGFKTRVPDRNEVGYWFTPKQSLVLASLTGYLNNLKSFRKKELLALTISSSVIRKWPNTISMAMDIDHSRPHKTHPHDDSIERYFYIINRIFKKNMRLLRHISKNNGRNWVAPGKIIQGDTAQILYQFNSDSFDLILTSPPYVNAIDYPRAHKYSEWWLSPEKTICTRENYIGLRGGVADIKLSQKANDLAPYNFSKMKWLKNIERSKSGLIYKYVIDMDIVIKGCKRILKDGGRLIFVLADNKVKGKTVPIVRIIEEIIYREGFKEIHISRREIKASRRRYPFGFKGVMKTEAIISALK